MFPGLFCGWVYGCGVHLGVLWVVGFVLVRISVLWWCLFVKFWCGDLLRCRSLLRLRWFCLGLALLAVFAVVCDFVCLLIVVVWVRWIGALWVLLV